jgi:hypothetical protein
MVPLTAAELWKIFDDECRKQHTVALCFGTGITGQMVDDGQPPEDLTVWENVLKRVDVRLKSRFAVEVVIDPATGEPVEKGA